MGKTFVQKAFERKVGREVSPGEIVFLEPDVYMSHDNAAAISKTFAKMGGKRVLHPERVVIILDHVVPAAAVKYAENHKTIRKFVRENAIKYFYDVNWGICHQVMVEEGHALPGSFVVGSDSHTTTYGGVGAFAAGIGRSEVAALWCTGEMWFKVPRAVKVVLKGEFQRLVGPKDLMLKIAGERGTDSALYASLEFAGDGVERLTLAQRMTIANLSAELGAKNGYLPPNDEVLDFAKRAAKRDFEPLYPDEDAEYDEIWEYDLGEVEVTVAAPHDLETSRPVKEYEGVKVDQIFLGTCTNGRTEDLELFASLVRGRKLANGVRLLVYPASWKIYRECLKNGVLETIAEFGGIIMNPGCGPCLGAHGGVLADGEVCFSTANRNFKGRMGSTEAGIYLGSPATAAAVAVTGEIRDPREVFS